MTTHGTPFENKRYLEVGDGFLSDTNNQFLFEHLRSKEHFIFRYRHVQSEKKILLDLIHANILRNQF